MGVWWHCPSSAAHSKWWSLDVLSSVHTVVSPPVKYWILTADLFYSSYPPFPLCRISFRFNTNVCGWDRSYKSEGGPGHTAPTGYSHWYSHSTGKQSIRTLMGSHCVSLTSNFASGPSPCADLGSGSVTGQRGLVASPVGYNCRSDCASDVIFAFLPREPTLPLHRPLPGAPGQER